ncbi:MAG TPA: hypothetical protein VG476_15645 [Acidimicrobiales bacterium]|nr:hypothetical protein [Acidimicrobiales bacterium]
MPGVDSLATRSVEWVRAHGGTSLVNWIEQEWYSHHQPPKGGTPKPGLIPAPAPTTTSPPPRVVSLPPHLPPPAPVVPLASPPIPGEGVWRPAGRPAAGGLPAVYVTAVRPDAIHTSLVTGVAWMDTKLLRATLYAGTQTPGGTWSDMASIPPEQRPGLVAAFNGGWRIQESKGGYYADGKLARPLVSGVASLVIRTDGTATVGMWGRDFVLGPDVAAVRQNLSLVVDGGQTAFGVPPTDNAVWRSGLGVTASGALVYAGGNGLSSRALSQVLIHAGALRAMELDINTSWVDFFSYAQPPGAPAATENGTKLVADMPSTTGRYFLPNSKDFIGMFAR